MPRKPRRPTGVGKSKDQTGDQDFVPGTDRLRPRRQASPQPVASNSQGRQGAASTNPRSGTATNTPGRIFPKWPPSQTPGQNLPERPKRVEDKTKASAGSHSTSQESQSHLTQDTSAEDPKEEKRVPIRNLPTREGNYDKNGRTVGGENNPRLNLGGRGPTPDFQETGFPKFDPDTSRQSGKTFSPHNVPSVWSDGKKGEDLTIQAYKQGVRPQSNIPSRPDYGATGSQVVLRTNYFHLLPDEKCTIFKYTVAIELPQATKEEKGQKGFSTRKKRQCFELLLKDPFFAPSLPAVATDYESSVLTCKKLALGDGETKGFDITYVDPHERLPRPGTKPIRMVVEFSHQVPVSDLLEYLKTPHALTTFNADMLQQTRNNLQTVIVRQANTKGENVSGSKNTKYYRWTQGGACTESYSITPGIISLKGYFVSVRSSTMRVLTNVNVCTSAFYEHGNLAEIMKAILQQENFQVTPRLMQWITGLRVRRIDTEEPKVKVIHGICASDANRYIIDLQGGKTIDGRSQVSVKRYFEVEHTYTIMNPNLPLIDVGSKDGTPACYLPAEVLEVLPGQAYRKKLRDNDEIKMSKIGVRPPAANAERITNAVKGVLNLHPQLEVLRSFKVRVLPEMLTVVGRILQAPRLMYSQATFTPQDAKWDITNKKLSIPARIDRWTFLSVETGGSFHQDTFYPVTDFMTALQNFGLTIGNPNPYEGYQVKVRDNDDQNIDEQLTAALTKISKLKVQFLLVTLGSKSSAIYSRLKYLADTEFGIHTVCCTRKTMMGGQAFANMALKVNLKFGGVNQRLPPTDIGCLQGGSTMIIGIDVTHPALGSMEKTSSIAAVVGSIDDDFAQWPASLRLQASRQEIVAEIGSMFGERLDAWQTAHKGALPKKIVIYRDGVSDSQYDKVIKAEIEKINEMRLKTYGNTRGSELIMIIGAKRHHTRFFPTVVNNRRIMDSRTGNCKPGTVVDRGITMEKGWDFYLQAHGALKRTAKPAHYIVVYTEFGPELTVDKVEQMTHNLCYLFGRATTAVSICPPAYYADLACTRGRAYLQKYLCAHKDSDKFHVDQSGWKAVHDNLKDSMFYI